MICREKMKIIFIGTVESSKEMLLKLLEIKAEIVGVITKEQSNFNADFYNLAPICKQVDIPYIFATDINSQETIDWVNSLSPDIIICFGWSSLIKRELLNIPKLGIIGYHPSELPKNRGRHPLIWALALGLEQTASTFFFMDEGADSGDILSQEIIEIDYKDNAKTLYEKMIKTSLNQIERIILNLKNNSYKKIKQDETKANYWRKRTKKDGIINFKMHSRTIYNLVRALSDPYVGTHLLYNDEEIKIWKVEEINCDLRNIEPGKVLNVENGQITVKSADGAIKILKHEFKKLPEIGEYL